MTDMEEEAFTLILEAFDSLRRLENPDEPDEFLIEETIEGSDVELTVEADHGYEAWTEYNSIQVRVEGEIVVQEFLRGPDQGHEFIGDLYEGDGAV